MGILPAFATASPQRANRRPRAATASAPAAFDPYRLEHFSNLARWNESGYEPADTAAYLAHANESFSHPNIVLDLRTPGTKLFRCGHTKG